MTRWLPRILLCLLSGALFNIAVTWVCAVYSPARVPGFNTFPPPPPVRCPTYLQSMLPESASITSSSDRTWGCDTTILELHLAGEESPGFPGLPFLMTYASGWPWRSMQIDNLVANALRDSSLNPQEIDEEFQRRIGLRRGVGFPDWVPVPWQYSARRLPVWPRPIGFLLDTALYALIALLVFFAPGTGRRAWRRRHNRCPHCAYPVGASPVCTECGRPVKTMGARL